MNISELARRLKITTNQLYETLPSLGVDIGRRAIKVDEVLAQRILKQATTIQAALLKKQKKEPEKDLQETPQSEEQSKKIIELPDLMTVRDLAIHLNIPVTRLIKALMNNGILAALNEKIDFETASIIAEDLGFAVEHQKEESQNHELIFQSDLVKDILDKEDQKNLVPRPPVVVIMGHVDHGKTKLLDAIRKTNVVSQEAGGITQHIGAYQIETFSKEDPQKSKLITFLDTPGHEAFTTMRSRGAKIADIAILVVAADEGVKPQTLEAIKIIKAARLPVIVAVNKIDKPESNIDRVKRELSDQGLSSEDWGGTTPYVQVSAKDHIGIDSLLEMILLVADMEKESLVANPHGTVIGSVIESHIDKNEGVIATLLIHNGTLCVNDYLVSHSILYGRVRAMKDHMGVLVQKAPPGKPVRILGFKNPPVIGDCIQAMKKIDKTIEKEAKRTTAARATHVIIGTKIEEGSDQSIKSIHVILRTDTLGSLEAIATSLFKIEHPEIKIKIISRGLGTITTADVLNAEGTKSFIAGFHVSASATALDLASEKKVEIKLYKIIYELIDDIKTRIEALIAPEIKRTVVGTARILEIFRTQGDLSIVGCMGMEGTFKKGLRVRLSRGEEYLGEATVKTLKAGKNDIEEARSGQEFGIALESKISLQKNDTLEAYMEERIKKTLMVS